MGDPELRSDENILLRTQGIYVKSIPFEGILTNKRIILIDRITNILPQKEIPLVMLKDFQAGENAIRDQIITLSVLAKTGETRQMILTFSRQTGGNRIKERDDWFRVLRENTSSSFEQVIRKVIPGVGQSPKKTTRAAPPRIEVIGSSVSHNVPVAKKTAVKKEADDFAPVKKIIESRAASAPSSSVAKEFDASQPGFGTYCSRCGNRVPDGSRFCNRCGSQIVVPGSMAAPSTPNAAVSQPAVAERAARNIPLIDKDIRTIEPLIEPSLASVPSNTLWAVPQQPEIPLEQKSVVTPPESISSWSDLTFLPTEEQPEPARPVIIDSRYSETMPPLGKPPVPQKPWKGLSFKPGKKAVLGIIVVIIIVAIVLGAFFLYPMIANGERGTPDSSTALTTVPTIIKDWEKTIKPTVTATNPWPPGNSGARVGL